MRAAPIVAALILAACAKGASTAPTSAQPSAQPIRVLMVTATAGFRHDSIPAAKQAVSDLARSGQLTVTATEDLSAISATALASTDVLMFALTTGELALDASQKSAIAAFVAGGGGFVGVHSAADTLYGWPDYGRIVGAYFKDHPWTREAAVTVEDRAHPITAALPASLRLVDEFYTFRENPRPMVHVLLSLDASSVGAEGDFPLAWTQTIGRGRSYYNALGHFDTTWQSAEFKGQLANGIRWAAGR